jgi:hypothetical protein
MVGGDLRLVYANQIIYLIIAHFVLYLDCGEIIGILRYSWLGLAYDGLLDTSTATPAVYRADRVRKMTFKSSDPLQHLPYEAWVQFIRLYAHDQPEGPLPLLAVSRTWERNLISAPEIWSTIYLDGGHDEGCRAECFFNLSRSSPVELVLGRNSNALDIAVKCRNSIHFGPNLQSRTPAWTYHGSHLNSAVALTQTSPTFT